MKKFLLQLTVGSVSFTTVAALWMMALTTVVVGCNPAVQSASGTKMATAGHVNVDANGHTVEQNAIIHKIAVENDPNKVWYLYVISPLDQKIIMKSTVKGKVTSSGKRLTPKDASASDTGRMTFRSNGYDFYTSSMPGEDGTYGDSAEYIYWIDSKGNNRRHYLLHGQIIHVVDKNLSVSELLEN